jgi:hypothetical protein
MMLFPIFFAVVTVLASGCAVHSPMRFTSMTHVSNLTENKHTPSRGRIFITKAALPASAKFERVAQIDVGRVTYGIAEVVLIDMADKARELGADAVVEVDIWFQVGSWAWAVPHGKGQAVKMLDKASVDFSTMVGSWY